MRYEIKYPMDRAQALAFNEWYVDSGHGFWSKYPPRQVNTIYFDSPDLDSYCDNLDGISRRRKLRLRWYGEDLYPINAIFEIKAKVHSVGEKFSVDVNFPAQQEANWSALLNRLEADLPDSLKPFRGLLHFPQVLNSYDRGYYEDSHGTRLTIDTKLEACSIGKLTALRSREMLRIPLYSIAEFKFPIQEKPRVDALLKGLPVRPSKFSKYVASIDRCFS